MPLNIPNLNLRVFLTSKSLWYLLTLVFNSKSYKLALNSRAINPCQGFLTYRGGRRAGIVGKLGLLRSNLHCSISLSNCLFISSRTGDLQQLLLRYIYFNRFWCVFIYIWLFSFYVQCLHFYDYAGRENVKISVALNRLYHEIYYIIIFFLYSF